MDENENWCRYADWRPNLYHQIKWVSSLVAVPNDLPLPPCMKKRIMNHNETTQVPERSFTSVQMVHTHAPLPRGFFWRSLAVKGYYPFPEAELASKYRERSRSAAELVLQLTRPHQRMPPCDWLDLTTCG